MVNRLLTISIKVNVLSICRIRFGTGTKKMKRNTQIRGLWGDVWKFLGGGSSNTGAGG